MKPASFAAATIAALAFAGASQANVTYTLSSETDTSCCVAGTIVVTGTITTDGATGVLSASDILGWNLTLAEAGFPNETLSSAADSSDLTLMGSYLTATSSGLYWNFAQGVGAEFSIAPSGQTTTQWHLYTNRFDVDFNGNEYAHYQDGDELIGSTLVPEPAVWAMMIVGLLGIGAALRTTRRERAVAAV